MPVNPVSLCWRLPLRTFLYTGWLVQSFEFMTIKPCSTRCCVSVAVRGWGFLPPLSSHPHYSHRAHTNMPLYVRGTWQNSNVEAFFNTSFWFGASQCVSSSKTRWHLVEGYLRSSAPGNLPLLYLRVWTASLFSKILVPWAVLLFSDWKCMWQLNYNRTHPQFNFAA